MKGKQHHAANRIDTERIKNLVKSAFQLQKKERSIYRVLVNVVSAETGLPDHLLVHIADKETYSYKTSRVNLRNGYLIRSIKHNYQAAEEDMRLYEPATYAACPDSSIDMVFATNLTQREYPTANATVDYAARLAESSGYKVKVLKGSQENTAAYANWLSCPNLKLIGRVGHGYRTGIMVADGIVSYNFFQSLGAGLTDKVLYFNSCVVHNNPLEPAIVNAGVQKFVGGDNTLYVGPSEKVMECWLERVISQGESMTSSLSSCEQSTRYPRPGSHGISGNGDDYFTGGTSSPGNDSNPFDGGCDWSGF